MVPGAVKLRLKVQMYLVFGEDHFQVYQTPFSHFALIFLWQKGHGSALWELTLMASAFANIITTLGANITTYE